MPLAALEDDEFERDVQMMSLEPEDRIILYTDGIIESVNKQGEMFGQHRLEGFLDRPNVSVQMLIDHLKDFTGNSKQEDDLSIIQIRCQPLALQPFDRITVRRRFRPLPWHVSLHLTPDLLRSSDPVMELVDMLGTTHPLVAHKDLIFTIVSELFSNALEHGLLSLDSSIKRTEEGYIRYYMMREERLHKLETGSIEMQVTMTPTEEEVVVAVTLRNSGPGFDYRRLEDRDDEVSFGRGVQLLRGLCDSIKYSDDGRCVEVIYRASIGGPSLESI